MPNFAQQQFKAEHVSGGSKAEKLTQRADDVRFTPISDRTADAVLCRLRADFVAKVIDGFCAE
jgi:hypothetical protein